MRKMSKIGISVFLKTIRMKANDGLKIIQNVESIEELSDSDQKKLESILKECRWGTNALEKH